MALFGLIILVVGVIIYLGGCMKYAEAKGHSMLVGLVGLLSCIGLLVLVMLPDRRRSSSLNLAVRHVPRHTHKRPIQ